MVVTLATSTSLPSKGYGYKVGRPFGSIEKLTAITAKDRKISYARIEEEEEKKTVAVIFKKKHVKKVIEACSLIVTIQGIAKTVVAALGALIKHVRAIGNQKSFTKFKSSYGFGFNVLDVAISSYALYDESVHGYKAYKIRDHEGVKDSSINVIGASTNLASIGTGVAAFAYKIKGVVVIAAACSLASSFLGAAAFAAYTVYQAVGLKRVCEAAIRLRSNMTSDKSIEEKYVDGLTSMKDLISVTPEERLKIGKKAKWDPEKIEKEIAKLLEKKHNKLVRRVGESLALYIEEYLDDLIDGINSKDPVARQLAWRACPILLNKYRVCLNKEITLKTLKVVGGILGVLGTLVALTNPVSAAILLGVSTTILLVAWYKESYKKDKEFDDVGLFNVRYFDYKIPVKEVKTVEKYKPIEFPTLGGRSLALISSEKELEGTPSEKWDTLAEIAKTYVIL